MKKYLIILALCLPALLVAQMTYVPDDNFEQALIDLGYDTPPLNDSVPTKNIDTVTYLNVYRKRIKDLTGIEDFKALTDLDCRDNHLTSLDISKNTALTWLDCAINSLRSLDVSKNIALTRLDCFSNDLTNLDVSMNSDLSYIFCHHNELTSLDVSKNNVLTVLTCSNNKLTSLDVSKNNVLSALTCNNNKLISLDVSMNSDLTHLFCYDNYLINLDVSMNSDLSVLLCRDNALRSLDVSMNSKLYELSCTNNPNLYCIQVADSALAANNPIWKKDGHGVWSEDCSLVSVEEEINSGNDITLSPNPAKDYIEISGVVGEVKLFDVLGAEVLTHPLTPSREGELSRIDVSSLSPGVYFVSVGGKMYKFVKM